MVLNFGNIVTGFYLDKIKKTNTGISDTTKIDYFDSNLYPSLIGWLPLKDGYTQDISIYDYNPAAKIGVIKAAVKEVKSGTYTSAKSGVRDVWMVTVTDEINEPFVPLEEELDCISNYLDLQKLRAGKTLNIEYATSGNLHNKKIAPLIFMTFVENAFKYGLSKHEESPVAISIFTEEKTVSFCCSNKIFRKNNADRTGIGIENTKKRLQHLYPQKHFLNINEDAGLFTVQLTIQI